MSFETLAATTASLTDAIERIERRLAAVEGHSESTEALQNTVEAMMQTSTQDKVNSETSNERLKTAADVAMKTLPCPRDFDIRDVRTVLKRAPPDITRQYNIFAAEVIDMINRLREETDKALNVVNSDTDTP